VPEPWRIVFARSAEHEQDRLESRDRDRVTEAIDRLATGDPRADVKRLQGYAEPTFRLRVGEVRVIFERDVAGRTLRVIAVRPRGRAYRRVLTPGVARGLA
jgi:mRNA-degrading endonuclease RelE of RelBE toxin-antitoxin system